MHAVTHRMRWLSQIDPKYTEKQGKNGEWRRLAGFSNHSRMLHVTPGSGLSWLHSQPSSVGLSMAVVWEEEVGTAKKLILL